MQAELERLLKIIEDKLDWGDSAKWQSRDFEKLNQLIFDKTNVSLSASTLRRLWGRVAYKHLPSATTLDTIAMFAGFENWRSFQKQNPVTLSPAPSPVTAGQIVQNNGKTKNFLWTTPFLMAVVVLVFLLAQKKETSMIDPAGYSFSSRSVTRQIPNSVIFTYDASQAQVDSVYIQQSWDPMTKTLVDKKLHQHTSIYYEPGFYHSKLMVGNQVVKEHPLMVPSDGWLAMISQKPTPVYLQPADFIHDDSLSLSAATIKQYNVEMEPMPPVVKYYNVGNFEPVPVSDFSFSTAIRNDYKKGAGACQFVTVLLITDSAPISFPLSAPGCVSELGLRIVDSLISGKKADLSGFGVDFNNWATLSCKSAAGKIQYFVNGKLSFESPVTSKNTNIVGILFLFAGTGSVKNVDLSNSQTSVLHGFGHP